MKEALYCQAGHHWTREAVRGRKPQWCPEHRPEPQKPAQSRTEPVRPTKKASSIDKLTGETVAESNARRHPPEPIPNQLYCEAGEHYWTRPPTRGKKPRNCPVHQPEKAATPRKRELSEEHKERLVRGRKEKAEARAAAQAKERMEQFRSEARTIDQRIAVADQAYCKSLAATKKAVTPEAINKAFNIADNRQQGLINLLARKRLLDQELAGVAK